MSSGPLRSVDSQLSILEKAIPRKSGSSGLTHFLSSSSPETEMLKIKLFVLVLLCCINTGYTVMCRYSQGVLKEKYSSIEVMCVAEIVKLFLSGYFATNDTAETDAIGTGYAKLQWLLLNSKKIIILVVLYSIANWASFFALGKLEASLYTVLTQLKTLSTAGFAVIILGRNISLTKWRALVLLVLGCLLVASPTFNTPSTSSAVQERSVGESILGICAVMVMVMISGYSAVYFEDMLKKSGEKITIWERNFQLAFYSAVFLFGCSLYNMMMYPAAAAADTSSGLFHGWTFNTVIITFLQASLGLGVAATLKYADAILKTLATAGAIVFSTFLGYAFLNGTLDIFVLIGCMVTIMAIFNYSFDESS
eukprot:gene8815-11903_t